MNIFFYFLLFHVRYGIMGLGGKMIKIWEWLKVENFHWYLWLMVFGWVVLMVCSALKLNDLITTLVLTVSWLPPLLWVVVRDLKKEKKDAEKNPE